MSHSAPPPNQPYGSQPPYGSGAPGAPGGYQGWPHQQPGSQGFYIRPPAPARSNFGLGLLAAIGAALVGAALYGVIIGLTKHEIGWATVGVGFAVGVAAGKAGGRSVALQLTSAVVSFGAVYLGQMVGEAMISARGFGVGFIDVFFQHFGLVHEAWKADSDGLTFFFFGTAAYTAFSTARKAGR